MKTRSSLLGWTRLILLDARHRVVHVDSHQLYVCSYDDHFIAVADQSLDRHSILTADFEKDH